MNYKLEIQKLLVKSEVLLAHDKINFLKQAVKLADANNDIEWGYELRMRIIEECGGILKDIEALPSFTWILDAYDAEPDKFDPVDMLWKYKWMIDSAARCHFVSIEQLEQMLEDYKKRLITAGFGLRAYFCAGASVGFICENLVKVKSCLDARNSLQRDIICDSLAYELYDKVLYNLIIRDSKAAFDLENRILSFASRKDLFYVDCAYAEYLVRYGEFKRAKQFIKRAEQMFSQIDNKQCWLTVSLGGLIYALTFIDKEKAWRYLSEHINWILECQEYDALVFGINILPLLKYKDKRRLNLSHEFPIFRSDSQYDTKLLFDYFYEITLDKAKKFDARNGNDSFKKQLKQASASRFNSFIRRYVRFL
ncbi:MAG: hypothetical protein LBC98_05670 [Prevotellaceae bacterium]|jgi:hypothetical protein|nr:hypothetical protein [Prevotellaceae bacterium]